MVTPVELPDELDCEDAEEFVELYYDNFDKSRHLISKFDVGDEENLEDFSENLPSDAGEYLLIRCWLRRAMRWFYLVILDSSIRFWLRRAMRKI